MDGTLFKLKQRLKLALPGWKSQRAFQPDLSYGRYFALAPLSARRAAVMVLLYPVDGQWMLPLTLRSHELSGHPGEVSLPGGAVDAGEAGAAAAERELFEELGVSSCGLRHLGRLSDLYLYRGDFAIQTFVAALDVRPNFKVNPLEVAELLELPLCMLNDVSARRTVFRARGSWNIQAPALVHAGHEIWGATRLILAELAAVVSEALDLSGCGGNE